MNAQLNPYRIPPSTMPRPNTSKTGTVLIVEDNVPNLMMAKELLDMAGFQTLQAENADAGIRLAQEHHPDLILMDMHLPVMDGYEASRLLKSDPRTADITIVAFTALAMDEEKERAIAQGCSGVISKPIDVDRFAESIAEFIGAPRPKHQAAPHVVRPVSPTEETSPQVRQLQDDLAKNSRELDQFIFRVSHDLQSPLRKITQFSEMLQKSAAEELSADNRKLLEGLNRSTQQMQDILSDLLTLSRLRDKSKPVDPVPLSRIVANILEERREQITTLGASIELGDLLPAPADPTQLKRLLTELIDNALKFTTETGTPVIRIACGLDEDGTYRITVEDNGIGLNPESAERIFNPMERLHGVSKYPGNGMGLAIARKIAECHGGTITVGGAPGQGTRFNVLLPVN